MPYILKKYYPVRNVLFVLGEGTLIFIAIKLVYFFYYGSTSFHSLFLITSLKALLVTLVFQLLLYFFDLYDLSQIRSFIDTTTRVLQAFGYGCIILAGVYSIFPKIGMSASIFFSSYIAFCLAILSCRVLYYLVLKKKLFAVPVVVIGTGKMASEITDKIITDQNSGYRIAAFIGNTPPVSNPEKAPVLSLSTPLYDACKQYGADQIVVALDDRRGTMPFADLLKCKVKGISVQDGISFYESITGKILVQNVKPAWIIFSDGFQTSRFSYYIKRIIDVLLALFGLFISLPVTLCTAFLIKQDSPGPIFYLQERVGEHDIPFKVIKFRSMCQDAEKEGAVWAKKNDNRVTKVGNFIRKVRIDEIPQMWNVLKGEMSFVGPRPERPVFVQELTKAIPYYSLRHYVKPGISGWAQVCYSYGASEEDALRKLEYDLYYIKNQSIFLDMLVIFKTVKTVLFPKGVH